ncbi:hypothetical protein D3C84_865590 [compost metagenome]
MYIAARLALLRACSVRLLSKRPAINSATNAHQASHSALYERSMNWWVIWLQTARSSTASGNQSGELAFQAAVIFAIA